MSFVCTVAKANNLYKILESFEGHQISSLDCYEEHLQLSKPSVVANILKMRLRIKGANAPIKLFPANLHPIAKKLKVLNIDQSAAIRWDQLDLEKLPDLEEVNYFFHKGYCKQPQYRIEFPTKSLVLNNNSKVFKRILINFAQKGILSDSHLLANTSLDNIPEVTFSVNQMEIKYGSSFPNIDLKADGL